MNVEIIEFYLDINKKRQMFGTLHIFLPDHDIHIRGIMVFRNGKNWFFRLPHGYAEKEGTGQKVWFPSIAFSDDAKNKCLLKEIMDKGKEYIIKKCGSEIPQYEE